MLVIFVALIVGPIVASGFLDGLSLNVMNLMQPTKQDNNDTTEEETGTGVAGGGGAEETDLGIDTGFRMRYRF